VLRAATSETGETSKFLNSSTIQRQNIENVTFLSSTATAPATGWWDVSAVGDNSIKAWATQTTTQATKGVYTVYIASDDEIFANQNSKRLFAHIGYGSSCTAAAYLLTDIELLNVKLCFHLHLRNLLLISFLVINI
jgi:hypothetical protein